MANLVLLADLSGDSLLKLAMTAAGERPGPATQYACRSLDELGASIDDFLDAHGRPALMGAAVAACGWESHGGLTMPNHDYRVQRQWLQERLDIRRLNLVNDCVCQGLSIQRLETAELDMICGTPGEPEQTRALIGVGHGLGTVAIVIDDLNQASALPCEGGHSDLPVNTAREAAVARLLAKKYGHVSRERAVSLPGLSDIWCCLATLDNDEARNIEPEEVVALACSDDVRANEAVTLSLGWLAVTASDLALISGARGGVYLAGNYFELVGDLLDHKAFRQRFTDKGRLSSYIEDIPVYIVKASDPELIGLTTLFE